MSAELMPPLGASDFWLAGAVFLVLVAVLLLFLPLMRRLRAARAAVGPVPEHVRTTYAARLDEVEARAAAGELTGRTAAQELSALLREFAGAAWGLRTEHMTVREMRERGVGPLADAIAHLYDAEFAREEPAGIDRELRLSREVITQW
ncbi:MULTISPECIES: c-type cytochrome biogenesis protein CcmI [Brevibacterium]|uniref:DUF4129 domain-containing protein n=1 Tax=Brevibacterium salitolerans TaxID=1403566 RepID=A0ABN2WYF2_9MICO|nr:c-type cytochrome biogenesis protein CcmI [Brevibacterium sp.]